MKKLLLTIVLAILAFSLVIGLAACSFECDHEYGYTMYPIQEPTCSQEGIDITESYCSKCGAPNPDFEPYETPFGYNENNHVRMGEWFLPSENFPGRLDLYYGCLDCGHVHYTSEGVEHDPDYSCPPHASYDEDEYCDWCGEDVVLANCPNHVTEDGDDWCDNCGNYIEPKTTPESIWFEKGACRLAIGETYQFVVEYWPEDAELVDIVWSTTTPDIISVDENGLVTAIGNGVGEVVAKVNGKEYVYTHGSVYSGKFTVNFIFEEPGYWETYQEGYKLVGIDSAYLPETLEIPAEYNGQPVITIANQAISGISGVREIIIPEGVKAINSYAINNCPDLVSVSIPSSIEMMYNSSIAACPNLEYYEDSMGKYLGNADNPYLALVEGANDITAFVANSGTRVITDQLFVDRSEITSIDLGSVVFIGWEAFKGAGITEIVIPDTVKFIGTSAFEDSTNLQSITIGNGVETIGAYSFLGCPAVEYLYYNAPEADDLLGANTAFIFKASNYYDYTQTINVVIGPDVKRIPNYAFESMVNYQKVVFDFSRNNKVTEIGDYAFYNVTSGDDLTLRIPSTVSKIGKYAYANNGSLFDTIDLGPAITEIGEGAFANTTVSTINFNCPNFTDPETFRTCFPSVSDSLKVVFGDSITKVPDSLFKNFFENKSTYGNFELNVDLSSHTTAIGDYAFYNAKVFSIGGAEYITSIGNYAFYGSNAMDLSFNNVITVGNNAFTNSPGLKYLTFSNSLTTLGQFAFSRTGLQEFTVPASVTELPDHLFDNCVLLSNVTFAGNVTKLGKYCFNNCTSLASVSFDMPSEIPDGLFCGCSSMTVLPSLEGVTKIGGGAFRGTGITELVLPASITYIGSGAFGDCVNLARIVDNATSLQIMERSTFLGSGINTDGIEIIFGENITKVPENFIGTNTANTAPLVKSISFLGNNVTEIGDSAFFNIAGITEISIPNSVKRVGSHAFANIASISTIRANLSTTVVYGTGVFNSSATQSNGITLVIGSGSNHVFNTMVPYDKVNTIIIEDGAPIDEIGFHAFSNYTNLESLTLHLGLFKLDMSAFFGCPKLTEINLPATVNSVVGPAGNAAITNSDNDNNIVSILVAEGNQSFTFSGGVLYSKDMSTLVWYPSAKADESFTVPSSVNVIAPNAFAYARGLQSVTLPTTLTVIPDYAFYACNALKTINLDHVTSLGSYAFAYTAIENFTAPSGVTAIPEGLFYKSLALYNLALGSQVKSIGDYAFWNAPITNIALSEGLETIGNYAFYNCQSLSNYGHVVIPKSVTHIGNSAFGYSRSDLQMPDYFEGATLYIDVYKDYGAGWYGSYVVVTKIGG